MERTNIDDLRKHIGEQVLIKGWLQTLRDQKKMQFLIVRDRTGLVQVAYWKPSSSELAGIISAITPESAVVISGKVVENPTVKLGGLEIQLETIDVVNRAEIPLPFDIFGETLPALDYRLDWRYIDLRRPVNLLIFKVQTVLEMALREFWIKNDFIEVNSPKLTGSPSEGGAELFELPYFERKAYLAQSPQFYKQMAMAAGFERVFEIGPAFRADPSFTSRHMTEFTSIDMEISWIDSHEDVMVSLEHLIQYVYQRVKDELGPQVKELLGREILVPTVPFPRITMEEAYKILKEAGYVLPPDKRDDIDPGGERVIGNYVKEKYNHEFVYLTDWSIKIRPFYHMRYAEYPELTRSFDLLATGLEIVTGAQREHRYEVLKKQALEKGLSLELIQYYLDFFRYGCPPHGGLGMGLARLTMVLLDLQNIREAVYLFRGPNRINP